MKTSPEKSQPAGVDERLVAKLLKQAAPFAEREWPYAGVSWQQLKRYNEYEEPSSNFRMTAEDKYLTHLYAGLAVYCRDVNRYLRKHRRKDASHFRQVVAAVHAEERSFYRETAFPYDNPKFSYSAELQKFPTGIAEDAAAGQPHLKWLNTHQIRHEWTVKAGKRLLRKFSEKFKVVICSKNGPYGQFEKGLVGQIELPTAIAIRILNDGISTDTLWYPLAVYVGLLLVKTGLKTFCEPKGSGKRRK